MTDDPFNTGRRKDGRPYKDGNTREDGSYGVGKNRPPASGQFAVGDGRKRGRRTKGVRNADTDFEEEYHRKITIKEGGRDRRVSKGRASIIRLFDNAASKGQTAAAIEIDRRHQRIAQRAEANRNNNAATDTELLAAFFTEWAAEQGAGPRLLSDPEPIEDREPVDDVDGDDADDEGFDPGDESELDDED